LIVRAFDAGEQEATNDVLWEQKGTVLLVLMQAAPELVMAGMRTASAEISAEFDPDRFMAPVFCASTLASD
jgi:hypothetical protein